jgi:hypothetical protein
LDEVNLGSAVVLVAQAFLIAEFLAILFSAGPIMQHAGLFNLFALLSVKRKIQR